MKCGGPCTMVLPDARDRNLKSSSFNPVSPSFTHIPCNPIAFAQNGSLLPSSTICASYCSLEISLCQERSSKSRFSTSSPSHPLIPLPVHFASPLSKVGRLPRVIRIIIAHIYYSLSIKQIPTFSSRSIVSAATRAHSFVNSSFDLSGLICGDTGLLY